MALNGIKVLLENPSHLRWACRRGMLELDVLLGNFLKNKYHTLTEEDKVLFIKLLNFPDPELFAWLMGREIPEDADMLRIVEIMRDSHRI